MIAVSVRCVTKPILLAVFIRSVLNSSRQKSGCMVSSSRVKQGDEMNLVWAECLFV